MKNVFQTDKNGCWIACVSMLTDVSYNEIKSKFKFKKMVTGRAAGPIVELLKELGFDCDKKSTKIDKVNALSKLDSDALIYFKNIDRHGDEDGGHWMVWDNSEKVIRDPEGWKSGTCFKIKNFRKITKLK